MLVHLGKNIGKILGYFSDGGNQFVLFVSAQVLYLVIQSMNIINYMVSRKDIMTFITFDDYQNKNFHLFSMKPSVLLRV